MTRQPWFSALALALAVAALIALLGACLSRAALRRAADKHKQIADEWARRCEAAEAREQAACVAATKQASTAAIPGQPWLPSTTRRYVEASLAAVADLLDSLDTTPASFAPRQQWPAIRSAVRTWSQTLNDLLDTSPLESRALIIDESATNLRELIDGVIALLAPSATQQGLRLSASIDRQVAETILADRARLGQLCFHLLNRTLLLNTHREIVLVVRTEPVNSRSQCILISVMETGARNASAVQQQGSGFTADNPDTGKRPDATEVDADACLPLCRLLAQRMQGELSITNGPNAGARASFNAPFSVEQWGPSSGRSRGHTPALLSPLATKPRDSSPNAPLEPFEHRYLDALSEEGVDLPTFLDGWRRAMGDDLARLSVLGRRQIDPDHLHAVLHRLSGAVGLVGALGLMEALRRASASPLEQSTGSIDALIERARNLVKQLDTPPLAYRNTQP
ncbi:sensor histidine kinase [Paraburkholderia ultramafica]|uniref:sensor histidine kinase n=1 Tax=Paraburkholderia ultramafica TaxID=1544867 RepID=UPI001FEB7C2B|nr:sensor histidine kinase [Paraburkholderia ultramafica]